MSSCHCYSQSDTFNLTLLFSPRLHGGLFQLFYGNYNIVSPVSWVNYCQRKQCLFTQFSTICRQSQQFTEFLHYFVVLNVFTVKLGETSVPSFRKWIIKSWKKPHWLRTNDQKLIGAAKWRMTFWLKSVPAFFEALRPSGKFFFVSTTKKIKKMCFNVKYLNGICLSQSNLVDRNKLGIFSPFFSWNARGRTTIT